MLSPFDMKSRFALAWVQMTDFEAELHVDSASKSLSFFSRWGKKVTDHFVAESDSGSDSQDTD